MKEPLPIDDQIFNFPSDSQPEREYGSHPLLFDMLGTKFKIWTDEDPEYLQEILAQYKTAIANTQSISKIKESLNLAILTGFLLCDEFNKYKNQVKEEIARIEEKYNVENLKFEHIFQRIMSHIDKNSSENPY